MPTDWFRWATGTLIRSRREEDKRLAYDSKASYMILSLMDRENPVLNSFHIEGTDAEKENLQIKE